MNFLRKLAPFLGTALSLGGPIGTMAGSAITAALGAPTGSKVNDVLAALTKPPWPPSRWLQSKRQRMTSSFK
jgi:hypothetical protein